MFPNDIASSSSTSSNASARQMRVRTPRHFKSHAAVVDPAPEKPRRADMRKATTWIRRNILTARVVKGRIHQDTICAVARQPTAFKRVHAFDVKSERSELDCQAD